MYRPRFDWRHRERSPPKPKTRKTKTKRGKKRKQKQQRMWPQATFSRSKASQRRQTKPKYPQRLEIKSARDFTEDFVLYRSLLPTQGDRVRQVEQVTELHILYFEPVDRGFSLPRGLMKKQSFVHAQRQMGNIYYFLGTGEYNASGILEKDAELGIDYDVRNNSPITHKSWTRQELGRGRETNLFRIVDSHGKPPKSLKFPHEFVHLNHYTYDEYEGIHTYYVLGAVNFTIPIKTLKR